MRSYREREIPRWQSVRSAGVLGGANARSFCSGRERPLMDAEDEDREETGGFDAVAALVDYVGSVVLGAEQTLGGERVNRVATEGSLADTFSGTDCALPSPGA